MREKYRDRRKGRRRKKSGKMKERVTLDSCLVREKEMK
jgi:hypothetical protein